MGNPGKKYAGTRHNVGVEAVRSFADQEGLSLTGKGFSSQNLLLLLPQTFMNRSGEAVREACDFYRIAVRDLMVVHDDLDLPLGKVKRVRDAGAAGHRGVASVIEVLGTGDFHRIRIGIGRPARKEEVEGFVLSPFEEGEKDQVREMIEEAARLLKEWVRQEET